jgi:hypothetical protein
LETVIDILIDLRLKSRENSRLKSFDRFRLRQFIESGRMSNGLDALSYRHMKGDVLALPATPSCPPLPYRVIETTCIVRAE